MADLDTIMSGSGSDSATEQTPDVVEQASEGQPRDPHGRFAPIEQATEQAAQPAAVEQQEQRPPDGFIPIQALDARLAKERERADAALRQQAEQFQRMLAAQQPQRAPPVPAPVPDQFEDFEGAVNYRVQPQIREAIDPLRESLMFNARLVAQSVHGKAAEEAEKAFNEACAARQIDMRDYERIQNSPNPFHAAVQWHKAETVRRTYGDDPEAAINAEVDRRLAERAAQQPQTSQTPPVMPTSFAGARSAGSSTTPVSGPRPLSDIMGGR